jgi:hypothetical protein
VRKFEDLGIHQGNINLRNEMENKMQGNVKVFDRWVDFRKSS